MSREALIKAIKQHREDCIVGAAQAGLPDADGTLVRKDLQEADDRLLEVILAAAMPAPAVVQEPVGWVVPGSLERLLGEAHTEIVVSNMRNEHYSEAFAPIPQQEPGEVEALRRAERKLSAYVGVCKDDKELTETVLPMIRAALRSKTGGEA